MALIRRLVDERPTYGYRRIRRLINASRASPAAATALMRMNSKIDIRSILPTIRVPTLVIHRTGDLTIDVEGGRYLAEHISGARYLEFSGIDSMPFIGDKLPDGRCHPGVPDRFARGGAGRSGVGYGSLHRHRRLTEKAAELGDRRWRDLLDNHHATIAATSRAIAAVRSRRPATVYSPPLTARRAACCAPASFPTRSDRWGWKCVPGSIRAIAKAAALNHAAAMYQLGQFYETEKVSRGTAKQQLCGTERQPSAEMRMRRRRLFG